MIFRACDKFEILVSSNIDCCCVYVVSWDSSPRWEHQKLVMGREKIKQRVFIFCGLVGQIYYSQKNYYFEMWNQILISRLYKLVGRKDCLSFGPIQQVHIGQISSSAVSIEFSSYICSCI